MMLRAVTKPSASPATIRWSKPGVVSRLIHSRHHLSPVSKVAKTNHIARTTPLSSISSCRIYNHCNDNDTIASKNSGRTTFGNHFTVAFLGVRAKSSCAFINHEMEGDEGVNINDSAASKIHDGVDGRSYQEAWMANLGRGDDAWLSGPRSVDWFTGLEPSVCPGENIISSLPRSRTVRNLIQRSQFHGVQ